MLTFPVQNVHALLIAFVLSTASTFTVAEPPTVSSWVVETHDGNRISLDEELKKNRIVVTIFWATWCSYCRDLLPRLNAMFQDKKNNHVSFVAMNIWEDGDPIAYMDKMQLTIPMTLKAENIAQKYGVRGTPGLFVIGEGHRVLYSRQPGETSDQVIAAIKKSIGS